MDRSIGVLDIDPVEKIRIIIKSIIRVPGGKITFITNPETNAL